MSLPKRQLGLGITAALGRCDVFLHGDEAVGRDGYRIDAALDEERGELGIIAGRLATKTNLYSRFMRLPNEVPDLELHRLVTFVEQVAND